MYRAKKDGAALLGWKHPWEHWAQTKMAETMFIISSTGWISQPYTSRYTKYHKLELRMSMYSQFANTMISSISIPIGWAPICASLLTHRLPHPQSEIYLFISSSSILYRRRCFWWPGSMPIFRRPIMRASWGNIVRSANQANKKLAIASPSNHVAKPSDK